MADPPLKHDYTYADYLHWDTGDRFELIDGIPYAMSPVPRVSHQAAVFAIAKAFDSLVNDAAGRFRKPDYYTAGDTARTIVAPTGRTEPARIFEAMKLPKKST